MNTKTRIFKTASRIRIAQAYGFSKGETIMSRISARLQHLTDEQLTQLGNYTGPSRLMPDQVSIIVLLLGTPENPQMLYDEK